MITKNYWYVLVTKPRAEKKVSEGLTKIGICHFLPVQKQLRQWKDRKKSVDMVLFHSYLFVQLADESRSDVFVIPGVVKYLTENCRPCMVSDEEIERIRKICRYEQGLIPVLEEFSTGDEVEITGGPLVGLQGRLMEKENSAYLSIRIENIGYSVSFKIDKGLVKKIRK